MHLIYLRAQHAAEQRASSRCSQTVRKSRSLGKVHWSKQSPASHHAVQRMSRLGEATNVLSTECMRSDAALR